MKRLLVSVCMVLVASAAFAQQQPAAPGPLVVERIQNGWIFSPDARVTDLDGDTGALAGGYLGRITDNAWVIGAGGYVLTNRDADFKLAYGGPVVEWLVRTDRRVGFGVRAIVGAGSATLPLSIADLVDERILSSAPHIQTGRRTRGLSRLDPSTTVAARDDFFVAEPQLNLLLNLSRGQRIVFGLGYRAVGNAPLLGDALNGLSGGIADQISGGR